MLRRCVDDYNVEWAWSLANSLHYSCVFVVVRWPGQLSLGLFVRARLSGRRLGPSQY